MMTIDMKVKKNFFDRKHVEKRIGKAKAASMAKSLGFIQRTAQNSMRKRKTASEPGQPPSRHFGSRNEGLGRIFFFYDENSDSGIVGPVKHRTKVTRMSRRTLPATLEFGGSVVVQAFAYDRQGRKISRHGNITYTTKRGKRRIRKAKIHRYVTDRRAEPRTVKIASRPFMSRALQVAADKGKIISAWKGSVTNG